MNHIPQSEPLKQLTADELDALGSNQIKPSNSSDKETKS